MSTLVGIVTFGNLSFTKLTVRSLRETIVRYPFDIFCVVGKPGDIETEAWLKEEEIPHVVHDWNYGFPYSVNDIYDYAWKENDYANLVIIGNDVVAYPHAIDSLIEVAETTDYDWVCSRQYDVKSLMKDYPQTKVYFRGTNLVFENFDSRPWEVFKGYNDKVVVDKGSGLSDVHNLALFKKTIFDKVGYIDVNFYPAYYEDNDYVRRAIRAGVKSCTVTNSFYFHFWSRTIHQETGGSTNRYFSLNRNFYIIKWGGDFGQETYEIPFDNKTYTLAPGLELEPVLYLKDRTQEKDIARAWKSKGA